ncbi:TIGR04086 family membrane protein [Thermohalobacter berrensis]|uniref:TIGR04086 family membrane protein n=1 Tax=Thermohalobacter berrensis TaxID=99594 RepID=A0A419TAZ3_9FIRM|nr:TIGR04086 family membrane protein [Thermohalobacter berrensis]RKD34658.1 hypothetical protein BET03_02185 [Thermohalobacter berrensis]
MNYNESRKGSYGLILVKGIGFSYVVTLICILIFAIVMTYTSISEKIIPLVNSIVMVFSIVLGAIYTSLKVEQKGWLNGGIVGLVYVIIIVLLSSIFITTFTFDVNAILKILIGLITGAIGGMIGINLK